MLSHCTRILCLSAINVVINSDLIKAALHVFVKVKRLKHTFQFYCHGQLDTDDD